MSWHAWLPRFMSAINYACTPRLRPKGYLATTLRAYRKREPLQWASPEDVWHRQRAMINKLLAHAVQNVPYYRSLHRAGSMPDRIERAEDMMAIPVLTKDTVRLRGEELVAENFPRSLMYRNATGGSTGAPVQFWSDEESNILTSSGEQWSNSLTGLDVRSPVALLWGVPLVDTSTRHRVAEGFYRALANRLLINCFRMGERELSRAHRLLTAFAPEALVGYANALAELAAFLRQKGLKPNYPSKAVISAAETLDDVSRKLIEQTFRVPVFNRYGSREFGLIAMECKRHVGLHIDCERIYLDMLDDPHSPGMRRILVTNLYQFSMPFIRYDIEDLAQGSLRQCPCGRGYPIIENVVGRVMETVRTPDGRCLSGAFFPHLFKDCGVRAFRIVQAADYALDVQIVKAPDQTLDQDRLLRRVMAEHLGPAVPVTIRHVEDIIDRTASGKRLPVISRVPGGPLRQDGGIR